VWRLVAAGALSLAGCTSPAPEGFDSPEPGRRIEAAVDAAARKDPAAVPGLIELLDSDDVGARMVAIRSLERITGQTLGYDYAAPEAQRQAAVARWMEWRSASGLGAPAQKEPPR
jgi:HEAT repeat protein